MSLRSYFLGVFPIIFLSACSCGPACDATKFDRAIKAGQIKVDVSRKDLEHVKKASTLVISCIDFRLRDEVAQLFNVKLGLLDDYDELVLPGASLAHTMPRPYESWKDVVDQVIAMAQKMHGITRVVLLDHRGCGAYKTVTGGFDDKDKEYQAHKAGLLQVKARLKSKFPALGVYALLMGLDGVVEVINN
jgi:carbonic anhydrase